MLVAATNATKELLSPCTFVENGDEVLHIKCVGDDFILTPQSAEGNQDQASYLVYLKWPKRIPGLTRLEQRKGFCCPQSDYAALVINAVWGKRVVFASEEARTVYLYYLLRFNKQHQVAVAQAEFWSSGKIPTNAPLGSHVEGLQLTPYQRVAAWCGLQTDGFALWMEQGTGKTATSIAILDELARQSPGRFVVIVGPCAVRQNWANEIAKFSTMRTRARVVEGPPTSRLADFLRCKLDVRSGRFDWVAAIMSYDALVGSVGSLERLPIDSFVIDEAHMARNGKTARSKGVTRIASMASQRLTLTGTPISSGPLDLYHQMELLGQSVSGHRSYEEFKDYHGNYSMDYSKDAKGIEKLEQLTNIPLLKERVTRFSFMCTKAQALPDLPEKTFSIHEVDLSKQQKKVYKDLAESLYSEFESGKDTKSAVTIQYAMTKMLRLAQVTSGFTKTDGEYCEETDEQINREIITFDTNAKMDALDEILETMLGEKSKAVIWAYFKQDNASIIERFHDRYGAVSYRGQMTSKVKEQALLDFNEGPARLFVANAGSAGTGLNLLGKSAPGWAADLVVRYSSNWSPLERSQSMDRTHRKGMLRHCHYVDILARGTVDFAIHKRVTTKLQNAGTIQDVSAIFEELMTCLKQS